MSKQKHRGLHPQDTEDFRAEAVSGLQQAAADLAWLKSRGYADASSLKLVGDRYQLSARQRIAVKRSSCSETALELRLGNRVALEQVAGRHLWIDGFNLLTTIEAALGGGVLLVGQDGCLRDMSSMHGNYRMLDDTEAALGEIHRFLTLWKPAAITWLLDQPVSNSGRLRAKILEVAPDVSVDVIPDPDPVLKEKLSVEDVVVTADSGILDAGVAWANVAREWLQQRPGQTDYLVDFSLRSDRS